MDSKTLWDKDKAYGDYFYKMSIGESPEMFSSIALVEQIKAFYKPGMKLLDVGCGAGHYLRSLTTRLDANIDYLGIDATEYYINLAKKAYNTNNKFKQGTIYNLPVSDSEFDIVMCNNLILHLQAPPVKALKELIRASKKYVIIRTVFGERNYIIQELRSENEVVKNEVREIFDNNGQPLISNYFNMYTTEYFEYMLKNIDDSLRITFFEDKSFNEFDNRDMTTVTGTKVINNMQVSGNLVLDWKFAAIVKQ